MEQPYKWHMTSPPCPTFAHCTQRASGGNLAMIDKRFVKKNKEVKDHCLGKIMKAIEANLPIPEDVIAWRSPGVRAERKRKRSE